MMLSHHYFAVAIVLLFSTNFDLGHAEFSCEGRECGHYGDPDNCTQFYECRTENGRSVAKIRECNHGLYFDQVSGTCDLPQYASCAGFSCQGEECGQYPDPSDCAMFYVCAERFNENGVKVMTKEHKSCTTGLFFNVLTKECDFPENVNCTDSKIPASTDSPVESSTTAAPGWKITLYEHNNFFGRQLNLSGPGQFSECINLGGKELCDPEAQGPENERTTLSFNPFGPQECLTADKQVTSIDTFGNCVRLYEQANCQGDARGDLEDCKVSGFQNAECDFNDMASSIGPC